MTTNMSYVVDGVRLGEGGGVVGMEVVKFFMTSLDARETEIKSPQICYFSVILTSSESLRAILIFLWPMPYAYFLLYRGWIIWFSFLLIKPPHFLKFSFSHTHTHFHLLIFRIFSNNHFFFHQAVPRCRFLFSAISVSFKSVLGYKIFLVCHVYHSI